MLERVRLRSRVDHGLGERRRACAATLEALVQLGRVRAVLDGEAAHELDLLVGVAGEAVHGDDRLQPEAGDDAEVPREVRGAALDRVEPSVRVAAVVLERRAVATSTTALGLSPPARQTMSKNFSIPMSEPKPDSVTT